MTTRRLSLIAALLLSACATRAQDGVKSSRGHLRMEVQLHKRSEHTDGYGERVAFSPTGAEWVSSRSGVVYRWHDQTLRGTFFPQPGTRTDRVVFARDGHRVLAAPEILDLATGEFATRPSLPLEGYELSGATFSTDGELLLVATRYRPSLPTSPAAPPSGVRNRLLLLDGGSGALRRVLAEDSGLGFRALAIGERWIAAAGTEIRLWDRASGLPFKTLAGHKAFVNELLFNSEELVSVGADRKIVVWDLRTGTPRAAWEGHEDAVAAAALCLPRPLFATGGLDGKVKIWSLTDPGHALVELACDGPIDGLAFDPTTSRLLVAVGGPTAHLAIYELAVR